MLCLFDAVGTLLAPRRPVAEVYRDWGAQHRIVRDLKELAPRVQQAIEREIWSSTGGATSEFQERRRWRRVVAFAFGSRRATSGLFRDLWNYFAEPAAWRIFPDVAECLQVLAERRVELAIASNFDSRLPRLVRGFPELAQIERIFVSSDIGWRKPDRRFFATIARAFPTQSSVWMIGDQLAVDVLPAREFGWQAVWLRRSDRTEHFHNPAAIDSLAQLPQLMNRLS